MAQAESFALHFKVPAILPGSSAETFVLVSIHRRYVPRLTLDANANRMELVDERFEGPADTRQRGRAFLVDLPQHGVVALGYVSQAHILILRITATS